VGLVEGQGWEQKRATLPKVRSVKTMP